MPIKFSNPYQRELLIDFIQSCGVISDNCSAYRFAILLDLPVFETTGLMKHFDMPSDNNKLFGFSNKIDNKQWQLFINECRLTMNKKDINYYKIFEDEKNKLDKAFSEILNLN